MPRLTLDNAAFYLSAAAVISYLYSIAAANILAALALATLLFSGVKIRFPPFWIPLSVFCVGTVISMALSADPSAGRPQVRKFLLYAGIPLLIYSTVTTLERVRAFLLAATAVMTASALWSLVQFALKVRAWKGTGASFYDFYNANRITGFMSHWMTVGGQEMLILLMAGALLFWTADRRWKPWLAAAVGIIALSLALGWTRSIWLGTLCGAIYLVWCWRPKWLLALPIPIALALVVNPFSIRERAISSFQPHGDADSNAFRYVCRRAGIEMIKAHPWFGLGPEGVKEAFNKGEFKNWVPPDVPRPLPTGWYGHLHNIYIHYAAERGIPTMLALLWLLGQILWNFWRGALASAGEIRGLLHGGVAVMLSMLIVGYYEVNLGDSEVLTVFLGIVTAGYSLLAVRTASDRL